MFFKLKEYPGFFDVSGIPVRLDSPVEAWAFDTEPPRRFPATGVYSDGRPISLEEFEALVAEARAS